MDKYSIELYANFALRGLLTKELLNVVNDCGVGTKSNTIHLTFDERAKRDSFAYLCNTFGFETQVI